MEGNKKCSLFPFSWSSFMQKIINTINIGLKTDFIRKQQENWRDKVQVVRLSTTGDYY